MNRLEELQEIIERQRNRLNAMIEKGMDDEAFYYANVALDRLIEEYIELAEQEEALSKREY